MHFCNTLPLATVCVWLALLGDTMCFQTHTNMARRNDRFRTRLAKLQAQKDHLQKEVGDPIAYSDYIQPQSGVVLSTGDHESWSLILTGIGAFVLIIIVVVVYAKRSFILKILMKLCSYTRAPDLKYPVEETGYDDQAINLLQTNCTTSELPDNNNTGNQSRNDVDTNDSGSSNHDVDGYDVPRNHKDLMPAILIKPTAPPEEAITDKNSAAEDETGATGANIARGSNTEALPTASQKEIHRRTQRNHSGDNVIDTNSV